MRTPMRRLRLACSSSQGRNVSIRGTMTKCSTPQNKPNDNHAAATSHSSHLAMNEMIKSARDGVGGLSVIGASNQARNYDPH